MQFCVWSSRRFAFDFARRFGLCHPHRVYVQYRIPAARAQNVHSSRVVMQSPRFFRALDRFFFFVVAFVSPS